MSGQLDLPAVLRHAVLRAAPSGACKCSPGPDVPEASAGSDMIRWGRVLLRHTLDAARSY